MSSRRQYIEPKHYSVHLTTDLDSGQFCGSVQIDFEIKQIDQTYIKLDLLHLNIDLSKITLEIRSSSTKLDCQFEINDFLEIYLLHNQTFHLNTIYQINIQSFSGYISTDNQIGFYRSTVDIISYNQSNTNDVSIVKKHYGITQMSPTHCRRVFPCFDDPSFRATFDLILDIPKHMHALSNMPHVSKQEHLLNNQTKRIYFQRTPSMPTFLFCFVIGEFDSVQCEPVQRLKSNSKFVFYNEQNEFNSYVYFSLSPIELTAYTLPGRKHEATFALNCARKALHFYADLFQIEYPMAKLDLVAVSDLFYPAMENWALILFKVRFDLNDVICCSKYV